LFTVNARNLSDTRLAPAISQDRRRELVGDGAAPTDPGNTKRGGQEGDEMTSSLQEKMSRVLSVQQWAQVSQIFEQHGNGEGGELGGQEGGGRTPAVVNERSTGNLLVYLQSLEEV